MSIVDFAIILSSLFTGSSVIFAIYSFKKKNEKEKFKNFRMLLIDLRAELNEISELLESGGYIEIGISISNEIRALFDENPTKEEVISYFKNPKNSDYLYQAIFIGLSKSNLLGYFESIITSLERKQIEHKELFPNLAFILTLLNVYIISTIRAANSIDIYYDTLLGKDDNDNFIIDQLKSLEGDSNIFRELSVWLSHSIISLHEEVLSNLFNEIYNILSILIDLFIGSNDKILMQISKVEHKFNLKENIDKYKADPLKGLIDSLYIYKDKIELENWDSIIEAKTKISTMMEKYKENEGV